ncbi:hypothetical protein ACQRXC_29600 (plasmid) [Niallia taxi]|uniref:hypothetical protein n=1 Tax=Niallia taxi TaxID=2499688 RepID=UPI003F63E62C
MELEDSKKIIKGEFGMNCPWYVGFEYKRDFEKNPLSWEENEKLVDGLIQVFEKYGMHWKMK